jgi:succinylglutamate desuccinylase
MPFYSLGIDKAMRKYVFVVCQHGDETTPLEVIRDHFPGEPFIIGNPAALAAQKRFLETDLNRSFPGSTNTSLENERAAQLLEKFKAFDYVIDLHTSSCVTPMFAITTQLTETHIQLAARCGVGRLVYMEKSIASGSALIDHVPCGISLECGPHTESSTYQEFYDLLSRFDQNIPQREPEIYSVFGILPKRSKDEQLLENIQAFRHVKKGEQISKLQSAKEDLYPILPREKAYEDILTLMARRIK